MPRRRGRGNAHVCMNPGLGRGPGGKLILRRHTVPEGCHMRQGVGVSPEVAAPGPKKGGSKGNIYALRAP